MDTNNWRPTQGAEPANDTIDWRAQLQPDSRQRIVNKIMDTLKRHLPVAGQEGLHELRKIAQRFEEKVYTAATSQSDYLRKISLKMLTMETNSQNTMANPMPPNQVGTSSKPPDSDFLKNFTKNATDPVDNKLYFTCNHCDKCFKIDTRMEGTSGLFRHLKYCSTLKSKWLPIN